jgi:hypothetical protein
MSHTSTMGERQDGAEEYFDYPWQLNELYDVQRQLHRLNPRVGPLIPRNEWLDMFRHVLPTVNAVHNAINIARDHIQNEQRRIAALAPRAPVFVSRGSGVKKKRKGGDITKTVRKAAYSGAKFIASQAAQRLVAHPALKAAVGVLTGPIIDTITGDFPEPAKAAKRKPKKKAKRS